MGWQANGTISYVILMGLSCGTEDKVRTKATFTRQTFKSWQTRVGKVKLVCVNGTKTVGKRVGKLLAPKELAALLEQDPHSELQ